MSVAALFFLGTFAPPSNAPAPELPSGAQMMAETVSLDTSEPGLRRTGALEFLEGWRLRSRDVRFGGVSAIHVEGRDAIALSDAGTVFRFPLPTQEGPLELRIERLARGPGAGRRKGDRDSEAVVVSGGRLWIAFEGRNQIWRYRKRDLGVEAAAAPRAMANWPSNAGGEAMVRLSDGRFIVFAEGPRDEDGTTPALLFDGEPSTASKPAALRYRPPPGYRITDAAALPDGRLILLNRRWALLEGFSAVLAIAGTDRLEAGALIEGRELAALRSPITVDNMEALSTTREGGRTILWVASDDNFNPLLQQTLLLKFALRD